MVNSASGILGSGQEGDADQGLDQLEFNDELDYRTSSVPTFDSFNLAVLRGADSRVAHMAEIPTTAAAVQYHAGARGFPVAFMSQVMAYWVVPPNVEMETA